MRKLRRFGLALWVTCFLSLLGLIVLWSALPKPVASPASWRTSEASGPTGQAPVRNFGVVEQGILYRSAQPHPATLPWLRRYGIKSVVNLREQQYDDGAWALSVLGFENYLQIPIDNYAPPTDAQAQEFLQFVQDQRNWPVLVHCAEGKGRTGVLVALTRYAVDGWSIDQALAEANNYTAKTALSEPQRTWLKQWASAHAPGDGGASAELADERK